MIIWFSFFCNLIFIFRKTEKIKNIQKTNYKKREKKMMWNWMYDTHNIIFPFSNMKFWWWNWCMACGKFVNIFVVRDDMVWHGYILYCMKFCGWPRFFCPSLVFKQLNVSISHAGNFKFFIFWDLFADDERLSWITEKESSGLWCWEWELWETDCSAVLIHP